MNILDHLLVWKENGQWLCACPYVDVVAQGHTKFQAQEMFFKALYAEVIFRMDPNGYISELPEPPADVVSGWIEKAHARDVSQ